MYNHFFTAFGVFLCLTVFIILGRVTRKILPEENRCSESKDSIRLCTGLVATLSALVLGLLVSTANQSFQRYADAIEATCASIMIIDSNLSAYSNETNEIRKDLRKVTVMMFLMHWHDEKNILEGKIDSGFLNINSINIYSPDFEKERLITIPLITEALGNIRDKILKLTPGDDRQRWMQMRILNVGTEITNKRWDMIEHRKATFPFIFLMVMTIWLGVLFFNFSLFSPENNIVLIMNLLCALSVSGSVLLFLELNTPGSGLIKASSEPFIQTIEMLGKTKLL